MATSVIQHHETHYVSTNCPVSLPVPATAGNLIVIWGITRGNGNTVVTPSGFTQLPVSPGGSGLAAGVGNTGMLGVFTKVAAGGEQTYGVTCIAGTGDIAAGIMEVNGATIYDTSALDLQSSSSHPVMTGLVGPGTSAAIIAVMEEGDSANAPTADAGWTAAYIDTTPNTGFGSIGHPGPTGVVLYKSNDLGTSFSPGFTYAGSTQWAGLGLVVTGGPIDPYEDNQLMFIG